jgi:two-component system chemotaxis sensor kinase CheA
MTTRELANTISGRGVGMDIVRESMDELGGSVDIDSTKGKGTLVRLQIPHYMET